MSIKDNRQRLIGVIAALTVAIGFLALHYGRQDNGSGPNQVASPRAQEAVRAAPPDPRQQAPDGRANPALEQSPASAPVASAGHARAAEAPIRWEPVTFDPQFHVYIPKEHEHHEYADQERFNTDTLKVYADNGDALAAFFVGSRLFFTDPQAGAEYLKLATVLSGKAGPLDVLAKKYSQGQIEDIEQAYLLGFATAAIGYYRGYEEVVPKTERMLWYRYDRKAAEDPEFSAADAMARLRARRAQIVRELNRSPLIQIDDSVDYPLIRTATPPDTRDGE